MNKLGSVVIIMTVFVTVFSVCAYEANILLNHVDHIITHVQNVTNITLSKMPEMRFNETYIQNQIDQALGK